MSAHCTPSDDVLVVGYAVHLPGAGLPEDPLLRLVAGGPAVTSDEAHTLLGRKGLLFKEPATRLALCAVHRALGLPPGRPTEPVTGAGTTAVVVSSNFGNVDTVADVVRTVLAGSGKDVSPLQSPNASGNVTAATIAIRYGFTGPNLTVCSGATSGLDAIRLGSLLLRAGRANRVVVVGVEPDDPTATFVAGELRAVAACVLLERGSGPDTADTGVVLGRVYRHDRPLPAEPLPVQPLPAQPLPADGPGGLTLAAEDLDDRLGRTGGALGVVQVALATAWLRAGDGPVRITCGTPADGYASTCLVASGARQWSMA